MSSNQGAALDLDALERDFASENGPLLGRSVISLIQRVREAEARPTFIEGWRAATESAGHKVDYLEARIAQLGRAHDEAVIRLVDGDTFGALIILKDVVAALEGG